MFPQRIPISALVDSAGSIAILYVSVWIYEISNYLAMSLGGAQASLVIQGFLPVGVMAASANAGNFLVKSVQVLISVSILLALFVGIKGRATPLTRLTTIGMVSVFMASSYWEALDLLGVVPLAIHEAIFVALICCIMYILSRLLSGKREI